MRAIAVFVLFCSASSAMATQAEYAFRWDISQGGPQNVADVLEALQVASGTTKTFDVQYFDIVQKVSVPEGYRVVGRERGESKKKPDAMLKIRGPEPIPQSLIDWKCPLKGKSEPKAEFDITVVGAGAPKRSYSVSCTVDKTPLAATLPQKSKATPIGCPNRMERVKSDPFTVELWKLASKRVVIEVSMEGVDSEADLKKFRSNAVQRLTDLKAVPLTEGMTELGSKC